MHRGPGFSVLVAVAALAVGAPATAATITVTTTQDERASGDGQCSLREAIAAINAPGSIGDCAEADGVSNTIVLGPHEYDLTIKPTGPDDQTTGDLDVNPTAPPLTIEGVGVGSTSINGAGLADRIMHVISPANVTIENLTVTGAHAPDGTNGQDGNNQAMTPPTAGTAGFLGGGLRNGGTLTLQDVAVTGNTAGSGGKGGTGLTDGGQGALGGNGGAGGGIENSGMLTLTDVTVSGNFAGSGGLGGPGGDGGLAGPGGSGGCCGDGGGLANDGGTVIITNSTFSDNHAGAGGAGGSGGSGLNVGTAGAGGTGAGGSSGGAIATNGGTVTITNSTLSGNFSGTGGNGGNGGPGDAFPTMDPSPHGGNSGNGSAGGAVFAHSGATVTISNVTVDGNRVGGPGTAGSASDSKATGGSTGNAAFGGGVDDSTISPATVTLTNTLLASNELGNCAGGVTDGGHNLSFSFSQCPNTFLTGDPKLGPLHDNGGPTQTEALGAGSAAIDQVPSTGAHCPATDQRGVARPVAGACDIGAYEVARPSVTESPASAITASSASLSGSVIANQTTADAHFEFGTTTAYGTTTPAQTIGGFMTPQTLTAAIANLKPDTTFHFRLVATSPDGTTSGPDRTFTTAPSPPRLTKLKFTRVKHGRPASITYVDTQVAVTNLIIDRKVAGARHGKRCVRRPNRARGGRCTILVKLESFIHDDVAGPNSLAPPGHKLAPGTYLLVATPTAGTLVGPAVSVGFRIPAPRPLRRR